MFDMNKTDKGALLGLGILAGAILFVGPLYFNRTLESTVHPISDDIIPSHAINSDDTLEGWERSKTETRPFLPPHPTEGIKPISIDKAIEYDKGRLKERYETLINKFNNYIEREMKDGKAKVQLVWDSEKERDLAMEWAIDAFRKEGWKVKYQKERNPEYPRYEIYDEFLIFSK